MTYRELEERHDIATLLFLRALRAPWTRESHASFSPKFRSSVKAIWLCARRNRYPIEVTERFCSFLGRDWWEDEAIECWNFYCHNRSVADDVLAAYERRQHEPAKTRSSKCKKCMVPRYCDKTCRISAFRDGHKSNCLNLPFSAGCVDDDEHQLYVDLLGDNFPRFLVCETLITQTMDSCMDVDMEHGDDEESSWETIESGDDEPEDLESNPTKIISQYFEKLRERRAVLLKR